MSLSVLRCGSGDERLNAVIHGALVGCYIAAVRHHWRRPEPTGRRTAVIYAACVAFHVGSVVEHVTRWLTKRRILMKPIALVLALALTLSGCALSASKAVLRSSVADFAAADLRSAVKVAEASKDLLPANDPWLPCLNTLSGTLGKLQAGPGIDTEVNGIFTEAMRLHILNSLISSANTEVKMACGAVFLQIMLRGAQRVVPGL